MKNERLKRMLLSGGFALICRILSLFQPLYVDVDNYVISWVVNDRLGGNAECFYISPSYRRLLGALSKLLPEADVFAAAERLLVFLALWVLAALTLSDGRSKRFKAAALSGLFATTFLLEMFCVNYTVWTTFFCCVGWACFARGAKERIPAWRWIAGSFFFAAGCALRIQGVLISLPFIAVDMVLRGWNAKTMRRAICAMLPMALLTALAVGEIQLRYVHGEFAEEYAFNEARMAVYDYPMMDYDAVKDELTISRNDYELISNCILFDTEAANLECMETMARVGRIPMSLSRWREALKTVVRTAVRRRPMRAFCGMILCAAALLFLRGSGEQKLRVLCLCGGAALIAMYFALLGRLPVRVLMCIGLCVLFGLLNGATHGKEETGSFGKSAAAVCCGAAAALAVMNIALNFNAPQNALRAGVSKDDARWSETTQGDALYIWTIEYDNPVTSGWRAEGWLPSKEIMHHNVTMVNWLYGQPAMNEIFAERGAENPMRALAEGGNVFFAGSEKMARRVETRIREHYAPDAEAAICDEINGTPIWRFAKEAE